MIIKTATPYIIHDGKHCCFYLLNMQCYSYSLLCKYIIHILLIAIYCYLLSSFIRSYRKSMISACGYSFELNRNTESLMFLALKFETFIVVQPLLCLILIVWG